MGVKNKPKKEVKGSNLVAAAVAQFETLLREHVNEALTMLDESEDKTITINCATKFNLAESEPQVESTLRFSQSVTDKRTSVLDDPDQGTFKPLVEAAEGETKAKREKNIEKATGEKKGGKGKKAEPEPAAGEPATT
jgi:hypothetical protein